MLQRRVQNARVYPRRRRVAGRTLVIKTVTLLTRRPDLAREEFLRHWKQVHAPLVLALPGVRRYVQCRPLEATGGESPYDGIAEVWYDSLEDLRATMDSAAYNELLADEVNFMGATTQDSIFMFVEEEEFAIY